MNTTAKKFINFFMFQVGWFLCVIMQDQYYLAGIYTVITLLIHHIFIVDNSREWLGVVVVVTVGVVVDSLFRFFGVLNFTGTSLLIFPLIPMWLIFVWILFATTLCHGLSWLNNRLFVAALLSAIAGPLSYLAGVRFSNGAVSLSDPLWLSIVCLSFFWCMMVPFSFYVMKKLNVPGDGVASNSENQISLSGYK